MLLIKTTSMWCLQVLISLVLQKCIISYYKYSTADYLDSLDYIICSQITDPTAGDRCDTLYDHLDKYHDSLNVLLDHLKGKHSEEGEAIAKYWSMETPKFTQDYDVPTFQRLEAILRETNKDINLFYQKIDRVKILWNEFKEECERNEYFCEPSTFIF